MKVVIEYGVWGDPLQEQLEKQGYKFKNEWQPFGVEE